MRIKRNELAKADYSWDPVSGCKKNCPYCTTMQTFARYSGDYRANMNSEACKGNKENGLLVLDKPFLINGRPVKFPFAHIPTLHKYLLDRPKRLYSERNIFVCDAGDLFGEWIPDEWITLVLEKCQTYTQHNYLFLTQNPMRYEILRKRGALPQGENMWYGTTITGKEQYYFTHKNYNTFLTVEPILEEVRLRDDKVPCWVIVGRETGNKRKTVIPEKKWVVQISEYCRRNHIPIFMKKSLHDLMGGNLIQERPRVIAKKSEQSEVHEDESR